MNTSDYRNLMEQGIGRAMDVENLCPDLEFAVARGITLVQTMHPLEEPARPRLAAV